MTDDEFLRALADGTLPNERFHHRDHLRLAWLLIARDGPEAGGAAVARSIRRFAAAHGHADKYHETLTQFWTRLVGHVTLTWPDIRTFDALLVAFPLLLDSALPLRHWRRETLFGAAARAAWTPPDLLALPF
jgi:hypothetical protein